MLFEAPMRIESSFGEGEYSQHNEIVRSHFELKIEQIASVKNLESYKLQESGFCLWKADEGSVSKVDVLPRKHKLS